MLTDSSFITTIVFTLFLSLSLYLISSLFLIGENRINLAPAWSYFSSFNNVDDQRFVHSFFGMFDTLLLPFIATVGYSSLYFKDYKSGAYKILFTKSNRDHYYWAGYIISYFSGFIPVFMFYFFNLLLWSISLPLDSLYNPMQLPISDISTKYLQFPILLIKSPYLFSLLYCIIPAIMGGCASSLSYAISLFYKNNKFIIISLPPVIYIIYNFVFSMMGLPGFSINANISPIVTIVGKNIVYIFPIFLVSSIITLISVLLKIFFYKDEV